MNEDEGFTIVDENFGVREASDASDSEIDGLLHPSSPVQHGLRSDSRNSPDHSSCAAAETSTPHALFPAACCDETLGLLAHHNDDDRISLGSGSFTSRIIETVSWPDHLDDSQERVPLCKIDDHPAGVSQVTTKSCVLRGRARDTSCIVESSASTRFSVPVILPCASEGKAAQVPAAESRMGITASGIQGTPAEEHDSNDPNEPIRTLHAHPRETIGENVAAAVTRGATSRTVAINVSSKVVRVRVVPGKLVVDALVPSAGDEPRLAMEHLEREVQHHLGLRELVHLRNMQTEEHDSQDNVLNVPEGGIVTVRPVDVVLVRVGLCDATLATRPSAGSSGATPSVERFVPLPLCSTWTEAMDMIRVELNVSAKYHAELRRGAGWDLLIVDSPHQIPPVCNVSDLDNGDALFLTVAGTVLRHEGSEDENDLFASASKAGGELSDLVPGLLPSSPSSPMPKSIANPVAAFTFREYEAPVDSDKMALPGSSLLQTTANMTPACDSLDGVTTSKNAALSPGVKRGVDVAFGVVPARKCPQSSRPCTLATPPWMAGVPEETTVLAMGNPIPASPGVSATKSDLMFDFSPPSTPTPTPTPPVSRYQEQAVKSPTVDDVDVAELVSMGFDHDHVVRALRLCGRAESWKEAAIALLLEPQEHADELSAVALEEILTRDEGAEGKQAGHATSTRCPICLSDTPPAEAFTVDCSEQHVFCLDCIHQHCCVQSLESGLIPACPMSNMSCGHELSQDEIERVFLLMTYSRTAVKGEGGGSNAEKSTARERRPLETCRTLLTRRGLQATGAIPCVSSECGNWMVPEEDGQRVRCSSCITEFCRRCKRSPYHYAAECGEVVRLAREWEHWLKIGKVNFLKAMAAQDEQHLALFKQHQQKKHDHERAVQEAERLRQEYDKMEDWKELRCRLCPKCGRIIEKLSGCEMMTCGKDVHGENIQNGCGHHFIWSLAPRYTGDRGVRKEMPFTETEPRAAAHVRHFIAPGIELRCDRCHQNVVGPLFRCIHCPSFACCLECQDAACNEPRHVHHTFEIVGREREERPPEATYSARADNRSFF